MFRLAQEFLETTDTSIEDIARKTGFGTAANLRHHFGRVTSVAPQTYRHVFRKRVAVMDERLLMTSPTNDHPAVHNAPPHNGAALSA